jgi:hypothetical protein
MAWHMDGTYFENCSCDAICPCTWSNLAHKATNDDCRFAMAFQVDSGEVDGVDVSGRSFALVGDAPAYMAQGGWRVGVFVDNGASEEQVGKLGEVLSGGLGGPPAALAPLLAEFLGIEQAPITIQSDGARHHVKVGDAVDYTGEQVTLEDGSPVSLTNIVAHPAGPTMHIMPVGQSSVSAFGVEFGGSDLSGFTNPFRWSA